MQRGEIVNLETILELEEKYTGVNHEGIAEPDIILPGNNNILVVATSGIKHKRRKKDDRDTVVDKPAHIYTNAIAAILNEKSGVHVMMKTRHSESDIAGKVLASFKEKMIKYIEENNIKYVIELRGSKKEQKSDILIGDARGSYLKYLTEIRFLTEQVFSNFDINVNQDSSYQGSNKSTIATAVANNTDACAVQMMIKKQFRNPKNNLNDVLKLIQSLDSYIDLVKSYTMSPQFGYENKLF